MQSFQPVTKRHEVKLRELRDERKKEQLRLDHLRAGLQQKIEAKSEPTRSTIRAA